MLGGHGGIGGVGAALGADRAEHHRPKYAGHSDEREQSRLQASDPLSAPGAVKPGEDHHRDGTRGQEDGDDPDDGLSPAEEGGQEAQGFQPAPRRHQVAGRPLDDLPVQEALERGGHGWRSCRADGCP